MIGAAILLTLMAFIAVTCFYFGWWLRGEHELDRRIGEVDYSESWGTD